MEAYGGVARLTEDHAKTKPKSVQHPKPINSAEDPAPLFLSDHEEIEPARNDRRQVRDTPAHFFSFEGVHEEENPKSNHAKRPENGEPNLLEEERNH